MCEINIGRINRYGVFGDTVCSVITAVVLWLQQKLTQLLPIFNPVQHRVPLILLQLNQTRGVLHSVTVESKNTAILKHNSASSRSNLYFTNIRKEKCLQITRNFFFFKLISGLSRGCITQWYKPVLYLLLSIVLATVTWPGKRILISNSEACASTYTQHLCVRKSWVENCWRPAEEG